MTTPRKPGRPRKSIDPEVVEKLASIQCTQEEIASFVGCHINTIRGRAGPLLDAFHRGQLRGKVSLRREQWKVAQTGNPTMLIWLGKQLLGQTDHARVEHSGPEGGGIPIEIIQAKNELARRLDSVARRRAASTAA